MISLSVNDLQPTLTNYPVEPQHANALQTDNVRSTLQRLETVAIPKPAETVGGGEQWYVRCNWVQ